MCCCANTVAYSVPVTDWGRHNSGVERAEIVTPAKAGVQKSRFERNWIPGLRRNDGNLDQCGFRSVTTSYRPGHARPSGTTLMKTSTKPVILADSGAAATQGR